MNFGSMKERKREMRRAEERGRERARERERVCVRVRCVSESERRLPLSTKPIHAEKNWLRQLIWAYLTEGAPNKLFGELFWP